MSTSGQGSSREVDPKDQITGREAAGKKGSDAESERINRGENKRGLLNLEEEKRITEKINLR